MIRRERADIGGAIVRRASSDATDRPECVRVRNGRTCALGPGELVRDGHAGSARSHRQCWHVALYLTTRARRIARMTLGENRGGVRCLDCRTPSAKGPGAVSSGSRSHRARSSGVPPPHAGRSLATGGSGEHRRRSAGPCNNGTATGTSRADPADESTLFAAMRRATATR